MESCKDTEISKNIWHLKQNKTDFTIKWSMIKNLYFCTRGSKRYHLCLHEKLSIWKEKKHFRPTKVNNLNKGVHAILTTTLVVINP